MNTTPSTPSTSVTPGTPSTSGTPSIPSTPHPNSSFAQFSPEQLLQISTWLEKHTYAKVIDLIQEHFDAEISSSALSRFYQRTAIKNLLADTPDTAAAAAEILQFAATNQPRFSAATVQLLEQTEFNLALTCHTKSEDLNRLARINLIICRTRNAAVRERHAAVQETRNALRARELELKAVLFNNRHENRMDRSARNNHNDHNDHHHTRFASDDMSSTHFENSPFSDLDNSSDIQPSSFSHSPTPASKSTRTTPASEASFGNSSKAPFKNPSENTSENAPEDTFATTFKNLSEPITFRPFPGMLPLPPEVIENNRRHAEKLLSGQIKLPAPGEIPPPRKSTLRFRAAESRTPNANPAQ